MVVRLAHCIEYDIKKLFLVSASYPGAVTLVVCYVPRSDVGVAAGYEMPGSRGSLIRKINWTIGECCF